MRKITRKQAVSNMQCLFDDFFKTYFNAPKEAIEETFENARFGGQKEKLRKAVYSTEYNTILGQLDSESFRKYYEKVGEFAKAYNIDTKLFTEETPAAIEDINDVLGESTSITEKLDLINGFTDEELKTDRISFSTKTALIESILDCWFVGDDKEQGINRMLMSLTAEDRLAFVNKIGTDRKFLNRLIQCVNGREKDEMLAVLGEIFIGTGLANEGTGTVIDNGQSDKIEASYNNGRVSITVLQEQGMGARDYRMTPKARYTVNALENISMYYYGRLINVPALLLLNSWSNDMAEPEGLFYNYRHEDIDWNTLDEKQKDEYFSEFVRHYLGEALFSELVGNPLGLILTTIVGILLAYFAAIPAAIMAVVGAGIAGANIYSGTKMLTSALEEKQKASNMHEYKKAAKLFAESITKIGVNTLMLIVSLVQTGKAVHKGKEIKVGENVVKTSENYNNSGQSVIWNNITKTADNIPNTEIPATFQIKLNTNIKYVNPKTNTSVLWTNANATEHMGEYILRFGTESDSIKVRSQIMLESYSASLNEAMYSLVSKPAGRYFGIYGNWELGIDTTSGLVYHAMMKN